jgi:hypothetical protein
MLTVTDGTPGQVMTAADIYASWTRLCLRLKRRELLGDYAAVLEAQNNAAAGLHLHVLVAEGTRGGGWIDKRELSDHAAASGFGPIVGIDLVRDTGAGAATVAAYLSKGGVGAEAGQLSAYLSKTGRLREQLTLADKLGQRMRPLRLSRSWPGGGLTATEREVMRHFATGEQVTPDAWERWHEGEVAGAVADLQAESRRRLEELAEEREARASAAPSSDDGGDQAADGREAA